MEMAKKAIKKQFNKKRRNLQELKVRDNMWLEAKNIPNQIDPQISWIRRDMDLLKFQRILAKKHFS